MAMRQNEVRNTQNLMESTVNSMEQYLKNMRQISDTVTYNIIQAFDVSSPEFNQQLSFLYDFNKDKIQSIALYDMEGNLIVAEPVTLQKDTASLLVKKSPLPQSAFSAGSSRAASARSSFQMVSSL